MTQPSIERHPTRRGVYRLTTELRVPCPIEDVFAFFADASNLEVITPPWLQFRVETPRPIQMRAGRLIDYRLRVHGVPLRWQSEISVWEPPYRFVDEQRRGPYRVWHHEHLFSECNEGTLVQDRVDYAVPGGWLMHNLLVRRDLREIFRYRSEVLEKIFASRGESVTRADNRIRPIGTD